MKHKDIIWTGIAALMLAACSSNEPNDPQEKVQGCALQVQASIAAHTRATTTAFQQDESIGVFAVSTVADGLTSGTNVEYVAQQNTVDFLSDTPIYYKDKHSVNVSAYYPYDSEVSDALTVALTPQVDYLFARQEKVPFNTESLSLTFNHVLSQLSLHIQAGEGVANLEGLTQVTLKQVATSGTLDLLTGELTPSTTLADYPTTLSIEEGATSHEASMLILPTTAATLEVVLTLNQAKFSTTLKASEGLKAGYHYTYTLTLKPDALEVSQSTITDWDSSDQGQIQTSYESPDDISGESSYTGWPEETNLEYTENE
jgi:hypothetical protein